MENIMMPDSQSLGSTIAHGRKQMSNDFTQGMLVAKIKKQYPNIKVSQSKISKIESGDFDIIKNIDLLVAIYSILGMSLPSSIFEFIQQHPAPSFVEKQSLSSLSVRFDNCNHISFDTSHELINKSLGIYHCIFRSTDSKENVINRALFELRATDTQITATLDILDINNHIIKTYSGSFFINTYYKISYCILIEPTTHEVCVFISNCFSPSKGLNEYIIALALTISSGRSKRPTMHRMLFSRSRIPDDALILASSQLKLNTDSILISKEHLDLIREDANNQLTKPTSKWQHDTLNEVLRFCDLIETQENKVVMYRFDEALLPLNHKLDDNSCIRNLAIAHIRCQSEAIFHNKASNSVQQIFADIVEFSTDFISKP